MRTFQGPGYDPAILVSVHALNGIEGCNLKIRRSKKRCWSR